jgi:selenide, water dikinase
LVEVLKNLPAESNPNLLVGFETSDDAGIYRINERQALVQTVDFFPPIVDDPYHFGRIAAANALSDIYAMGGTPLTALNIVAFPSATMAPEILAKILQGGAEKVQEAGAVIVGGHSIKDKEIKYGIAVTGIIDCDKIIRNVGAQIGDHLYLTKPLGTGIVSTALKHNAADPDDVAAAIAMMETLNNVASELMVCNGAHAATDITGYGLLGHAYEMANGSGVSLKIDFNKLPLLSGALKYATEGHLTGGAGANREYISGKVDLSAQLTTAEIEILYDAQTSGGLLIAISPQDGAQFVEQASQRGLLVRQIGAVMKQDRCAIIVDR